MDGLPRIGDKWHLGLHMLQSGAIQTVAFSITLSFFLDMLDRSSNLSNFLTAFEF